MDQGRHECMWVILRLYPILFSVIIKATSECCRLNKQKSKITISVSLQAPLYQCMITLSFMGCRPLYEDPHIRSSSVCLRAPSSAIFSRTPAIPALYPNCNVRADMLLFLYLIFSVVLVSNNSVCLNNTIKLNLKDFLYIMGKEVDHATCP